VTVKELVLLSSEKQPEEKGKDSETSLSFLHQPPAFTRIVLCGSRQNCHYRSSVKRKRNKLKSDILHLFVRF
jgi:hypothetical protein